MLYCYFLLFKNVATIIYLFIFIFVQIIILELLNNSMEILFKYVHSSDGCFDAYYSKLIQQLQTEPAHKLLLVNCRSAWLTQFSVNLLILGWQNAGKVIHF